MKKIIGALAALTLCVAPVAQADPDPNTEIIGNAGADNLPLPMTPGDGIGPAAELPPEILPAGPFPDEIGPAAYSPLEDPH